MTLVFEGMTDVSTIESWKDEGGYCNRLGRGYAREEDLRNRSEVWVSQCFRGSNF